MWKLELKQQSNYFVVWKKKTFCDIEMSEYHVGGIVVHLAALLSHSSRVPSAILVTVCAESLFIFSLCMHGFL